MRERGEAASNVMARLSPPNTRNTSPTLSLGKTSLSESLGSVFWPPVSNNEIFVAFRGREHILDDNFYLAQLRSCFIIIVFIHHFKI